MSHIYPTKWHLFYHIEIPNWSVADKNLTEMDDDIQAASPAM